jgi:hypothetical protein
MAYLWQLLLVVKHETRMVVRSWPFRILSFICFSLASLQVLGTISLVYFVSADSYLGPLFTAANTTMIGLAQMSGLLTWIVIFFANDIGTRDKRVGISDVVGSRPLSTGQYVTGRLLGLMLPLTILMAVFLAASLLVNTAFGFRTASFHQYASFFFHFGVLGVGFAAALAAFFSTLLRNRLLAALAAIAPIIVSAIWLAQYHSVFDIGGYSISNNYSDLIGYGPIGELAIHRLTYLCLTLLLVSGTAFFYPRAEAARRGRVTVVMFVALTLTSAGLIGYYVSDETHDEAKRQQWREALTAATTNRAAAVDHYDMDIEIIPRGGRLRATVTMLLKNRDEADRDAFVFALNPGLHIDNVSTVDGASVAVVRRGPVVELTLDAPLPPGGTMPLVWDYGGKADPRAAWLTAAPFAESWQERNVQQMAGLMGGLSGWVGRRFCFFLPESQWYPIPNSTFGYAYPDKRPANFAEARITLRIPAGWTGVTQGALVDESAADSSTTLVFETDTPVPQFSLCAGEYTKVSTRINGIDCAFFYAPVHRENVDMFADTADEIGRIIGESLEHIADTLELEYPYKSLSLVEVPSNCRSFSDSWDGRNLHVQPGVLLISESDFFSVYFAQTYKRAEKQTKKEGTGATNAQIKAELVKRYFARNAFSGNLEVNLIPSYWEFQIDPAGTAYPALGAAFTAALSERALGRHQRDASHAMNRLAQPSATVDVGGNEMNVGMPPARPELDFDQEQLILPLGSIMPSGQDKRFVGLMNRKTEGLLRTLETVMGEKEWRAFVPELLDTYRFKQITLEDLEHAIRDRSEEDASWVFDQFVSEPVMPGYMITHAEAYEIDAGQRERQFQTVVRIANIEAGKGYVRLLIETEGSADDDTVEQDVFFSSLEEKEIRKILSDKPKSVRVMSACSRNVQDPFETLYVPEERRSDPGEESVRNVPVAERQLAVTVDDMDEGFSTINLEKDSRVRLVKSKEAQGSGEYPEYRGFGAPRQWRHETTDDAYGKYLRTRKIKRRGDGSHLAVWSASLPQDGIYEVLFYTEPARRGRYRITVENGESSQEVDLELKTARSGWNSLGKYRFSEDSHACVKLSDDVPEASRNSRVYADAIRWVYQDTPEAAQ